MSQDMQKWEWEVEAAISKKGTESRKSRDQDRCFET